MLAIPGTSSKWDLVPDVFKIPKRMNVRFKFSFFNSFNWKRHSTKSLLLPTACAILPSACCLPSPHASAAAFLLHYQVKKHTALRKIAFQCFRFCTWAKRNGFAQWLPKALSFKENIPLNINNLHDGQTGDI